MIVKRIVLYCPKCNSSKVVKNGMNSAGNQQFLCKACDKSLVIYPELQHSEIEKEQILSRYRERPNMRGIACLHYISRNTLKTMLQKKVVEQPTVQESLLPAQSEGILELDEIWSFIFIKTAKYWLWIALTQIVAFVIGNHYTETCQRLWNKVPKDYQACLTFSDFRDAYQKVFPEETHRIVGKDTGQSHGALELHFPAADSQICLQDLTLF